MKSGAVYAYSYKDLDNVLKDNHAILSEHGWPDSPVDFVRRIAAEWLDEEHPIMPVIMKAFGDR